MKTKAELERNILSIFHKIQVDFPELSKYIDEMPESFPKNSLKPINEQELLHYYDSLSTLYNEYASSQKVVRRGG